MKQAPFHSINTPLILTRIVITLLILLLTACSAFKSKTFPSINNDPALKYNWQQQQTKLKEINHWQISGKISIRTPDDSVTAAINKWTQKEDDFTINLSSTFFGLGATRLVGNDQHLTIFKSDEKPLSSNQPDLLISQALGFSLPVSFLPYWIKALPTPQEFFKTQFYTNGLPKTLFQGDWKLEFSKYLLKNELPLPGKIKLQHNDTRIILVIKKWTLL